MTSLDFSDLLIPDLFQEYVEVNKHLRAKGIITSSNNPVTDLTKLLVEQAFNLKRAPKSRKGFDDKHQDGTKYEIKGRRISAANPSTQLSSIRSIGSALFDYLVAVIFNEDFAVREAYKIPHYVVKSKAHYRRNVNAHILVSNKSLLKEAEVEDITPLISQKQVAPA